MMNNFLAIVRMQNRITNAQDFLCCTLPKQLLQSKCAIPIDRDKLQQALNRIPPVDNTKNFKFAHIHLPAYLCTWQQEIVPLATIPLNYLATVSLSMTFY